MKKLLVLALTILSVCHSQALAAPQVKTQKINPLSVKGGALKLESPYKGVVLFQNELSKRNLPKHYKKITIEGEAKATPEQAVALLKLYNYKLPVDATPEQLVRYYMEESKLENLKWDLVFSQALLETGFFKFGGTVVPEQNNFCGLGTTSATVQGASFIIPEYGVRAHVQHLLAYTRLKEPKTTIIDPRYDLVHNMKKQSGFTRYWSELNGKWATGSEYSEKIIDIHEKMQQVIAATGNEI